MKLSTKSILLLTASVALMFCGERASAQSNTSQAVQRVQSGNKVFLEINATQLESELNQLFQSVASSDSAAQSISWGDVLGNGANPGMDINFSSYDITGLGGLTSTGTLAADSLTLAKDAAITGRLSVLDAVSFGDSLTVSGFVEFSDSLEVVKAVTIGETLYVTGVTSLGDSVHVAGNVDLDALFNVDGAATFGSSMTVSGETTLNDSLHVAKSADFAENVEIGQNLYVDSISNLHTNGLSLSANEFAAFSADTIRADFDNLYFTGRFENDPDGRIALEMESYDESPYNEYDGRFYAEHAEAFSGLEFDIDEDEDDADIKIEAVATNNGTEYGRARVYAESEGDHADAGFSVLADDDTDSSTGEFEIDIDSDDGEAEAHIDLRDGWSLRAELEFERSDWDDSYDITLRTDEGDVDVVAGDLLQLTGDRFVTLTADSVIVEGRFGSRFGASFDGNVEIDGETTLNDSLQVNSGANIDGMLAAGSLGAPNLFVDDIAPFNGPDLTLSTTSSTFKMTEDMLGNYPEFASVPEEQLSFLLGNNTGVHSQSVARSAHVEALDTRTASIQSDVALARVQASATQLDWIATTDVASDFVTDSGQISPAAGLGFPIEALETTFLLQNIQEIPRGFLGAGRYALNPEVTNPELAGQGIDQAIWAQDTLLLQGGYNSDDNEMKSTLAMVEEGIAVNANSFYVTGETTLNDSLHVNSGMDVSGDLVVNDTNLLQIIASLEARIAALESEGETPQEAFTCGTSAVTFDGHDYSTVEIGDQCWFAENLRTTQYADGSAILEVTDGTAWKTTNYAARAAYNNDASNLATYGYLYNWYAVDSAAGLCPTGWHVPTDEEWTTLTTALGGESEAGVKMKSSASDTPSWNGTNTSGFSALPGGWRYYFNGNFQYEGIGGYWWSASPDGTSVAWFRKLLSGYDNVVRDDINRRNGFSVRCLRDADGGSSASAPTVSSAAASDLAETTATLNGTVDADGGDAVTATGFVWGTDASLSGASNASGSATSGSFTASLTGLTGGTTYYFSAYATNGEGTDYGDTLSFTTTPASAASNCGTSAVTFDGHAYSTVEIGDQCWFAENLRTTQYADGSSIPEVTDGAAWTTTNDGAHAAYNNDASNLTTYGYLYNWHAVNSAAGLCPSGWHVPTDAEWTTLTTALGGESEAGVKMKSSAWNGTNTSGFSALPGGWRASGNGSFNNEGDYGFWWSASPDGTSYAWYRLLSSANDVVSRNPGNRRSGFSVRCLRDE